MSDIGRDYSFGGWLRYYRINAGLTLRDAAKKLKMDPGNLSRLERSELDPPFGLKLIKKLCSVYKLGTPMIVLLKSIALQHHIAKLKIEFES